MKGQCLCASVAFELDAPLPNPTAGGDACRVPVGLLEDSGEIQLAAHLFTGSRASRDRIADQGLQYEEMPDADSLQQLLERRHSRE